MSCPAEALDQSEIVFRLETLPGWTYTGNALERVYDGQNYLDSLEVLNAVARLSEAGNHHPDLILSWKKLTIRYWTHTARGVTALDFELAAQVEAYLAQHGETGQT